MTPSAIEPATFRLVERCLNQLRHQYFWGGGEGAPVGNFIHPFHAFSYKGALYLYLYLLNRIVYAL